MYGTAHLDTCFNNSYIYETLFMKPQMSYCAAKFSTFILCSICTNNLRNAIGTKQHNGFTVLWHGQPYFGRAAKLAISNGSWRQPHQPLLYLLHAIVPLYIALLMNLSCCFTRYRPSRVLAYARAIAPCTSSLPMLGLMANIGFALSGRNWSAGQTIIYSHFINNLNWKYILISQLVKL